MRRALVVLALAALVWLGAEVWRVRRAESALQRTADDMRRSHPIGEPRRLPYPAR